MGYFRVVKALIKAGALTNLADKDGHSASYYGKQLARQ